MITACSPICIPFIYCPIPTLLIYNRSLSKPEYRLDTLSALLSTWLQLLEFQLQLTQRHKKSCISMAVQVSLTLETAVVNLLCINNMHNSCTC